MSPHLFCGTFQIVFQLTAFVFTMSALQDLIRSFPKAFRVFRIDHFPMDQNNNGHKEQAPAEEVSDKQHRCKHHKVAPVINPAVHTAFVLHDKGLKGTEQ